MANPRAHGGTFDQLRVRRANMSLVLATVAEAGELSRASLAVHTGLNKTTVSNLVSDLIQRGMLVETGEDENPGAVGRPAQTLRVSGENFAALGLDIDYDRLAVAGVDLSGAVRWRRERTFDTTKAGLEATVGATVELAREALEGLAAAGLQVVHVAVAVDAVVDANAGMVVDAPDLGWAMVPLSAVLREALAPHVGPLHVENDANVAALAELWFGAGRGLRDFVYLWGSMGVGAGIVSGGTLFRGGHGFGGEFGHVTVDPDGRLCSCGRRGCLSMYAGIDVLLEQASTDAAPSLSEQVVALVARAESDDPVVLEAIGRMAGWLALGLTSLVNILDPQAIILGGWYAPLAPWLRAPIQDAITARALNRNLPGCQVLVSELGEESSTRGGAALSLRRVLEDPSSYDVRRSPEAAATVPSVWERLV